MIDVHTHILPFIDDGAETIEQSYIMIEEAIANGITHIILTPHVFRPEFNSYDLEYLESHFNNFKKEIESKYNIKLFLGQEVTYNSNLISILKNKSIKTLNNTNYLLLELPYEEYPEGLDELLYSCNVLKYNVIFAHAERYKYFSVNDLLYFNSKGILLQVNSSSINSSDKNIRKKVFKLFNKNAIAFVSSDIHSFRKNTMKETYEIISKKYGKEIADNVYKINGKNLLKLI